MSFIDRIHACNHWNPADFIPFSVDGEPLGWLRSSFADQLAPWPEVFLRGGEGMELHPGLVGFEGRSTALAGVIGELVRQGVISHDHKEPYPVGPRRERPLLVLDRAAAPHFGIRAYGQHINGYVREGKRILMWVGRRAANKRNFPNRLDHIAAGGLPHGIGLLDNLEKECWEEAGIPGDLARRARPVGALTYCRESAKGLKPDTVYCYDLELPREFVPHCTDGEMESFSLLPLERVAEIVRDTEEFKWNCSLVIIDFLVRHGWLGPETDGYLDLIQGLHPRLP